MIYIKLDGDMDLAITVNAPIYRGDNLANKITYLIPETVGELNVEAASVFLTYIRADGVADIISLERQEEKYNETYFQFTIPVTCKMSKFPGEVCTWLTFYSGSPSLPQVAKSGECVLFIQDSKCIDGMICDNQLTALYQLQKQVTDKTTELQGELEKKADGLSYDKDTRDLRLKSGDDVIGDPVRVPSDEYADKIAENVEDTWSDMEDGDEDAGEWEPM